LLFAGVIFFLRGQAGVNLDELIKGLIIQALELSNGNRTRAAKLLGLTRPTLIYRLEKYGIEL
jgi:two-component system response regulator AtoC